MVRGSRLRDSLCRSISRSLPSAFVGDWIGDDRGEIEISGAFPFEDLWETIGGWGVMVEGDRI